VTCPLGQVQESGIKWQRYKQCYRCVIYENRFSTITPFVTKLSFRLSNPQGVRGWSNKTEHQAMITL
jgi:hypothetical protein